MTESILRIPLNYSTATNCPLLNYTLLDPHPFFVLLHGESYIQVQTNQSSDSGLYMLQVGVFLVDGPVFVKNYSVQVQYDYNLVKDYSTPTCQSPTFIQPPKNITMQFGQTMS